MFEITKEFHFSASHQLEFLKAWNPHHQCARLHGHNYVVEFVLRAPTTQNGFVQDYGELEPIKRFVDMMLDHRHLNDVFDSPDGLRTTAEHMAQSLYLEFMDQFPLLVAVRVRETPKTCAEYRP